MENEELKQCDNCEKTISAEAKFKYKKLAIITGIIFIITLFVTEGILTAKAPTKIDIPAKEVSALDKGIAFYEEGKYADATEEFNKAIEESNEPEAYFYIGKIKEKSGDKSEAIYNYQEAIKLNPLNKKLIEYTTNLCIDEEDYECVSEHIEEAYGINQNNYKFALHYAISGNLTNEEMFKVLRTIPQSAITEYYYANKIIGYHYFNYGEYKNAIPYLQKAYNLRDKSVESYRAEEFINNNYLIGSTENEIHLLVVAYIRLEHFSQAIKLLDEMIKNSGDPQFIDLKERCIRAKEEYNRRMSYEKEETYYTNSYGDNRLNLKPKYEEHPAGCYNCD